MAIKEIKKWSWRVGHGWHLAMDISTDKQVSPCIQKTEKPWSKLMHLIKIGFYMDTHTHNQDFY